MVKSKIKFYQTGSKKINDDVSIEITWKVVNDSDFCLKKVKGYSQEIQHNFDEINPHSQKEFKFTFKIPSIEAVKKDFGEDAKVSNPFIVEAASLCFTIKNDTFKIKSDSLKISF